MKTFEEAMEALVGQGVDEQTARAASESLMLRYQGFAVEARTSNKVRLFIMAIDQMHARQLAGFACIQDLVFVAFMNGLIVGIEMEKQSEGVLYANPS